MKQNLLSVLIVFVFLAAVHRSPGQEVRSPQEHLGRPIGTDFQLADWTQVSSYYRQLAEGSPRVVLKSAGKTTEGRDLLYAIISSEANLKRLDEIKKYSRWITDPRQCSPEELTTAKEQGKVILFITPSMHSNEPAATEMAMQLAWQLATLEEAPWTGIRDNLVVVLLPSLNPDGVDHIVHWYRKDVGTPLEGAETLKLYQYYTGHDNNRDWFALTQNETRLLTKLLYQDWSPQVLWDIHQQGETRERFFVPPYRDPLNPNLDANIVAGINTLGQRAIQDMTREGLNGIASGANYDNWWNGGNRSVPCRHHIIGILTESASVNMASPIFIPESSLKDPYARKEYSLSNQFLKPWPGGWWRLQDIHRHQLAFGKSLMSSLAREPRYWLENKAVASQNVIDAGRNGSPKGWLLPLAHDDLATVQRFAELLMESGVELHRLTQPVMLDHHLYEAGTLLIRRDQPYGNYVKDLVELKTFPANEKPYDIAGWSLGALFGLHLVEVRDTLPGTAEKCASLQDAVKSYRGDIRRSQAGPASLSLRDFSSWTHLAKRLSQGEPQAIITSGPFAGLVVPANELSQRLKSEQIQILKKIPRIGIYAPWKPSMDEGWIRWMMDHSEIPFLTLHNETLRAGELNDIVDVIVFPDLSAGVLNTGRSTPEVELPYNGGLAPEGLIALEQFVRNGGKVVAVGGSAQWLIAEWNLPLRDVTTGASAKGFQCTGSVLRGQCPSYRFAVDLPSEIPVLFAGARAWEILPDKNQQYRIQSYFTFASNQLLLSGHIDRPEVIEGKAGWVSGQLGQGQFHLFSFRPYYRGWTQGAFPLFMRALFLDASETTQRIRD